jgi:signal transduction histidine kinase/CheY-like chemotaxis protein
VHKPAFLRCVWPNRLAARLTLLVAFTAALSVFIAGASALFMGWKAAESRALADARKDARSIAFSLSAPLAFADPAGTREVLELLSHQPDVLAVWVHDAEGRLLHSQGALNDPATVGASGSLREGRVVVTQPVVAGRSADLVGMVTLRIDLSATLDEFRKQIIAAAIASLMAMALTVVLARQMARRLSVPVVCLAEAAEALTRDWSNPRRLTVTASGEIGVALTAYNHMVDELERRDAAVHKLTDELRDAASIAEAARAQAESASQAKTRFLANMSHELRSPLNGVIGAAQLLRGSDRDPAFREELIRIIQTSGSNLLDLIEGVLDVSRIEAGRMHAEQQPFNLLHCVEAALAPAVAGAAVKNLILEYQIDADVPGWCVGDAPRLKQLLQNLLGNAVKFTDAGTVSLAVSRDAQSGQLCFVVTDTGVGIQSHMLASIFEPFQQGDPSATRRFGGSGLGLTICREVARLMNGDVRVESVPGQGSRFTLLLPLPAVAHAGGPPVLPRTRLRCYEPSAARRNSLAALLHRLGCRVQFLEDLPAVQSALAKATQDGDLADAWLVAADAEVGTQVLKQVLAAGGSARIGAMGKVSNALGTAELLSRPLTLSALQEFLESAGRHASAVGMKQAMVRRTVRSRVLLVEDDSVNRLVVSSLLEGKEVECLVAINGGDAMRFLEAERFDAVLMDWQMPDMDGLEVTRRLRAGVCGELNRAVPVIALTANAFAEDRNACMAAGMNDFLTKPVQLHALRQCVLRWCRHTDATATELQLPVVAARQVDECPAYEPAVLASLRVATEADVIAIQNLLQLFCSNARAVLAAMEISFASEDWQNMQRNAHTLKSSAGQVGAMALSRLAAGMESRLRAGEQGNADEVELMRDALARFMSAAGLAHAA